MGDHEKKRDETTKEETIPEKEALSETIFSCNCHNLMAFYFCTFPLVITEHGHVYLQGVGEQTSSASHLWLHTAEKVSPKGGCEGEVPRSRDAKFAWSNRKTKRKKKNIVTRTVETRTKKFSNTNSSAFRGVWVQIEILVNKTPIRNTISSMGESRRIMMPTWSELYWCKLQIFRLHTCCILYQRVFRKSLSSYKKTLILGTGKGSEIKPVSFERWYSIFDFSAAVGPWGHCYVPIKFFLTFYFRFFCSNFCDKNSV